MDPTKDITIVVTPRERFSCALRSMKSLLASISSQAPVVYIDAGTPGQARENLHAIAKTHNVTFIEAEGLSSPNHLRNLAAESIKTTAICFVDNDLLYQQGWLDYLARAADEEHADIAHPICLIGEFEEDRIHHAGGRFKIDHTVSPPRYRDEHLLANQSYSRHKPFLSRADSDYAEFHCLLIQSKTLCKLGFLDEDLLSLDEHIDLCMKVKQAGGKIVVEPSAVVTYTAPSQSSPFWIADAPIFKERWSEHNNLHSVQRFSKTWGFHYDEREPPSSLIFGNWALRQMVDIRPRTIPSNFYKAVNKQNLSATNYPYVHSFPRLIRQCCEHGFSPEQLQQIRLAFDLAASIHKGALRGCRLPFIDHCVGVASVLVVHGFSSDLVVAGLLHAIYLQGASSRENILEATPSHRGFVQRLVGKPIETLLFRYPQLNFLEEQPWEHLSCPLEQIPLEVAAVLMLRVANEIEMCLDDKLVFDGQLNLDVRPDENGRNGIIDASLAGMTSSQGEQARVQLFQRSAPILEFCGHSTLCDEGLERIHNLGRRLRDQTIFPGNPLSTEGMIETIAAPFKELKPLTFRQEMLQRKLLMVKPCIPARLRRTVLAQRSKNLMNRLIAKL
ncbi:DUF6817 domain-containing protein [Synechococcus sp. RedBA-s]|uniref:DUF6817 domain-containing protein n=1 Tax=Synechococcus sp. RedBA-s TaxID=2823741 RepID=UPI0020CE1FFD|nr:glycosyltransferase [Synechococcus sp. RedBA-s]MCP9801774.1 glycosyltransferase [Synechococcus sp. RedBA-s]